MMNSSLGDSQIENINAYAVALIKIPGCLLKKFKSAN